MNSLVPFGGDNMSNMDIALTVGIVYFTLAMIWDAYKHSKSDTLYGFW